MKMFIIESGFSAPGSGRVFVGLARFGEFAVGDTLTAWDAKKEFLGSTKISGIRHFDRDADMDRVENGERAALKLIDDFAGRLAAGSQLVAEGETFVDLDDPSTFLWRRREFDRLGLALQGGGMKGAFGVGALTLLAKIRLLQPNQIKRIASASTGSLTALVAATGRGEESARLAREQYLDLKNTRGLFTLRHEVTELMGKSPTIKRFIEVAIQNEGFSASRFVEALKNEVDLDAALGRGLSVMAGGGLATAGSAIAGLGAIPIAAGVLVAWNAIDEDIDDLLAHWQALLEIEPSLATLGPVKERLLEIARIDKNGKNPIQLRLAVTDFNSGATAFLTEKGHLLAPPQTLDSEGMDLSRFEGHRVIQIGSVEAGVNTDEFPVMMINGALASGAFPGLFEPIEITFERAGVKQKHVFFDGGVRENMPLEILLHEPVQTLEPPGDSDEEAENALFDTGRPDGEEDAIKRQAIERIIAIYCSPLKSVKKSGGRGPWVEKGLRAIELTLDEVARTDSTVGRSLNRSDLGLLKQASASGTTPDVIHIAPGRAPLGLTQVEPRHIANAIWYGYMRAFDELWIVNIVLAGQDVREVQRTEEIPAHAKKLGKIEAIRDSSEKVFENLRLVLLSGRTLIGRAKYFDASNAEWITYAAMCEEHEDVDIQRAAPRIDSLADYRRAKADLLQSLENRLALLGKSSLPFEFSMATEGTAFLHKEFYRQWDFLFDARWQSPDERVREHIKAAFAGSGPMHRLFIHRAGDDGDPKREGHAGSEIKDLKRRLENFGLPTVS